MEKKPVTEPSPLLPFLFAAWPDVKRTKIKQWLKFGAIRVNGNPVTQHDHGLRIGDTVALQPEKPVPGASALPVGMRVVFEDSSIIVIEKPAKLLTVATDGDSGQENTAYFALTDYVKQSTRKTSSRVWIVHRLDKDTSGLLVFAKTQEAKQWLQTHWSEMEKTYLAVVDGRPPAQEGTLRSHIDESQPHKVFTRPPGPDSREAITHYKVIRSDGRRTLVELKLETGRRHQIRLQLSDIRCPIVGDAKYGSPSDSAKRLALHASRLKIRHPDTEQNMEFEAPLPKELASLIGRTNPRREGV